ncbi:hypothetical protein GLOIN_2v1882232 [Rhizophagus clarus]|uniref:Hsp70 family protein n=1 Tax=Rhizophagus clarus TaxID=94130 RepID=A0A8H3LY77_9GLOM|nr:hypothetical protein GLOIN_2v1882232 [Rhizophagus clarus]
MSSELIRRLITDFNNLNEKCVQLIEENQNLKQQNQNLQQENQSLKEKLQEKDKLLEKLQERENQYENLEQHVKNLEKQKSEDLQQLQQLELISQNLQNNLGILNFAGKAKKNEVKIIEEKNEFLLTNKNDEQKSHNIDKPQTLFLNNKDFENSSECSSGSFSENLKKDTEKSKLYSNIQVVVGIDFGTISSAYSIENVTENKNFHFGFLYPKLKGTILEYVDDYSKIYGCGYISGRSNLKIVELFKLHLGGLPDNLKPNFPIEYKRAIADYLKEIGKDIKAGITMFNAAANHFENVLLVFTVPEEYSEKDKDIMRESEAAAIYCMKNELQKHNLLSIGKTFIIVDCGGSTTDITTHKLNPLQLSEVTELIRDFCGSRFIDEEIIKLLHEIFGPRAIDLLITHDYNQFRYMVREISQRIKESFAGDNTELCHTLDVEEKISKLMQHVSKETKKSWKKITGWIIRLIRIQLSNNKETCSAMFLIGGFSNNKYLQKRIKQEFQHIENIQVTDRPIENDAISSIVLKYTYGIQFTSDWKEDVDPPNRKTSDGKISKFISLVKRGTEVTSDQAFTFNFKPAEPGQTHAKFEIYYTNDESAAYIDEEGMKLLGALNIDLPDVHLDNRSINFELTFGPNKITALAKNELNGQRFLTKFCFCYQ